MEITRTDLDQGLVEIRIENLDDLWVLKNIVKPGDRVKAKTSRRQSSREDMVRSKRSEKIPVTLTIEIEKIEFHKHTERLRLLGIIVAGDEDSLGDHHTINVEVGKKLSIYKENWRKDQLERLRESGTHGPNVGILTIEEGEAFYGLIREFGVDKTFTLKGGSGKRFGESGRQPFFGKVTETVDRITRTHELDALVIAGPGFTKKDFINFFLEKHPEHEEKVFEETCSGAGPSGVQEVLRRGAVEKAGKKMRLAEESQEIQELLQSIKENKPVAYGEKEVNRAVELGAVEKMLITDKKLRKEEKWGEKLEEIEQKGGNYLIFSVEHDPGQRLEGLGGVAAKLRFPIK